MVKVNNISTKDLSELISDENDFWSEIFEKESSKVINSFSHYWWELYYKEMISYVKSVVNIYDNSFNLLEAGSGSGKASILLGKNVDRTFLDISSAALDYAKKLANHFQVFNIKYIEGNIFEMPFPNDQYSLVWNIGVIEHYNKSEIKKILEEMARVTKQHGRIIIGFPNFQSLQIQKARLLKCKFLKFIPGYRLGSEIFYTPQDIIDISNSINSLNLMDYTIIGNPLFIETPKFILNSIGRKIDKMKTKNKFLHLLVFEKSNNNIL